jgi:homoserine dehydrogenase
MTERGRAYAEVLADAQAAGYAEADPTGDVEGDDAVNKLVILARLAFGSWLVPASIERRPPTVDGAGRPGISGVSGDEIKAASAVGLILKLVARAGRRPDGTIAAGVLATALPADLPLARIGGIENRVEIDADPLGRVAFAGPGAGGRATSSAVLGDLIAIARGATATWAGLAPADGPAGTAAADDGPRRRFFASTLPEQLVRDQLDIEAARGGGFITTARPLEELRADLGVVGVVATLYPIGD